MIDKNFNVIRYFFVLLVISCLFSYTSSTVGAQDQKIENIGDFIIYKDIQLILTPSLISEKCWQCHQDMYPDKAPNPNSPAYLNISCFTDPNGLPYPLYYSSLDFKFNPNLPNYTSSESFKSNYEQRKKGHLSHLIYQPFGLGRRCLDCHDSSRYTQGIPDEPHPSDRNGNVYFYDGQQLIQTTICTKCHGGVYPEGSTAWDLDIADPNDIEPSSVRLLIWGDPGSVTCLQCHDDSSENGGIYASYTSRYSSEDPIILSDPNHTYFYHDWIYSECTIRAPDPDKVYGQNYWSKSGHGVKENDYYAGATLDTGYPDPNRPNRTAPNKGAMNSQNIPTDKHSQKHDLDLDSSDGEKNFCWECHWSNEKVRNELCSKSNEYPERLPIGKYNGHLDTKKFRDERWGDPTETVTPHHQWKECRECHPAKYSHFVFNPSSFVSNRLKNLEIDPTEEEPIQKTSHCIVCHNPHGSGDEEGNVNVFMIKRRIYKPNFPCNHCHFSQFQAALCDPYPYKHADPDLDTWVIDFNDPLRQDIRESGSTYKSLSIPAETSDICEACHQQKEETLWIQPGVERDILSIPHRNGSGHYFNPNDMMDCSDPNDCMIDYRGTDCTGCHIHDPGSVPDAQAEKEDPDSSFNSKAFAPTCRCHGISKINIATLTYDTYWGDGNQPDIAGKGHGTPPPPFPDGNTYADPHMGHARYNFQCLRCHINPDGPAYDDSNKDYIFKIDNLTPVGFDYFINPNGIYDEATQTCSNLYCHSNGKGEYADPIAWTEEEMFCRNPNDPNCRDPNDGHPKYCDNCHITPPNGIGNGTDHGECTNTNCDICHPHKGVYEGKSGFYKHVNKKVEILDVANTFGKDGCGCCHDDPYVAGWGDLHFKIEKQNILCTECHLNHDDPNSLHVYLKDFYSDKFDKCKFCHNFTSDPKTSDTITISCNGRNIKGIHSDQAQNCKQCHLDLDIYFLDSNISHYIDVQLDLDPNWVDSDGAPGNECSICHNQKYLTQNWEEKKIHNGCDSYQCIDCHNINGINTHCDMLGGMDTWDEANDGKCKCCHDKQEFDIKSDYGCDNPALKHESKAYNFQSDPKGCKACHENEYQPENHFDFKTDVSSMPINELTCKACHTNLGGLHDLTKINDSDCQKCHSSNHCQLSIKQEWGGDDTCGICHEDPLVSTAGITLHAPIPEDTLCEECHGNGNHQSDSVLHDYLNDPKKCSYCHGVTPTYGAPIGISFNRGGVPITGTHPSNLNCQECHPGVYSRNLAADVRHYEVEANELLDILQSWEGPNSCGACHIDQPVIPCGGGPPSIHAALGPNSDCALCHGTHTDMIYGDTPNKCIACHGPNPAICDICGPGSITTHYAFDTMGINQAAIADCLSCHVEPIAGGEANPLEHIDNPQTFVREGACLGCHSLARVRHGPVDPAGCYTCHPMHCVTQYARNDACIWCHTANPPIVDICQAGLGITSHMAFDSSVFNQIQVTNCIGCHVEPITGGESNPINHIDDPMTYVNPLTCMGCHTVVVPHGGSGLPWQGGIWPLVNCYACHPKHCFSLYCDNQACIWCHTEAPPLVNVCGRGGIVPHTGDCVNCHAAGSPTGGECTPPQHIDGITYVRDGTCVVCHPTVPATHKPGTEACVLCHPIHCAFTYCSEPQCKLCHNQPVFDIVSDYGCGIGLHDAPAYKECTRCHPGECDPQNHTLSPLNLGRPTDLRGMRLDWMDCGLCHAEAQSYHAPCNAPCTLCHSGVSNHACTGLDYCAENKCKCCHASRVFPINSDYGCGIGFHESEAYIDCTLCHINECNPLNHMDKLTDVSNMRPGWPICGLCHQDAQAIHVKCPEPCTMCHSGQGNHSCLELNYCAETACKCCHADPAFPIHSDYGCGIGTHAPAAYIDCTLCHVAECLAINHLDRRTDVSNMPLDWPTCGLCHQDAQAIHVNCPEPCTMCHSGQGNHSCLELNYCAETACKCCHILDTFPIISDYGCGTGTHPPAAYVDCTMCHIGECLVTNHLDQRTDVSNMPLDWPTCGLCHVNAQAIHTNCTQPCNICHSGQSNHSCLALDYCAETRCKCCHALNTFPIISDYGCGTGTHPPAAYVDCTMCHIGECAPGNHIDTVTDVSNMPLEWPACGLCHANAQASHANCIEPCTLCHSGTSTHACTQLDYCADQKCRCCHINMPYHANTLCDCATCHSAECDPLEHDITGVSTSHPMNPLYYNYTGTSASVGCTCCHGYPPQCLCVGISNTQDHCLDLVNGCSPQIFDCLPCHTLFNGQPNHIYTVYATPAVIASCACHGDAFGTTGAHTKHLTTPVMVPVYGTGNVIDCQACHSATTNLAGHVVCLPGAGVIAPVQFDAALPMIGGIDSYTPGATPGTGSCNLYCHSDGTEDPLDVPGTYFYFLGAPPLWNQTTGIISCGNAVIGTTAAPIYQCHGYPPPTHPGGAGGAGGGIQNCAKCHPTPLLGVAPNNTVHINGFLDVTGGGFGAGVGPGGGGVGGGIPVI